MMTTDIMIPAWVDGVLTPVEKLDAHVRGLKHKAISVFILRGTELLIQKRAAGKYHTPGLWANTCCTHPEWDEAGMDCAHRRLDEELGIKGVELEQKDTITYRAYVGGGMIEHEVVEVFVGRVDSLSWDLNPDEVERVKWVDLEELKSDVERHKTRYTAWLKIYLEKHADMIFGDGVSA